MTSSRHYPDRLTEFVKLESDWPDSWKMSHKYDELEIWGRTDEPGYTSAYRLRFLEALDLISKSVPRGAHVLDVAAAQGNFSIALSQLGYRVTWNDLRTDLADYVRLKARDVDIELEYLTGNIFDLGLQTKFDAILATEIIEHVAHPNEFLSKLAALLVPNGVIILTTPNGEYFRNRLPKFSECDDPSVFESVQFKPNADGHIFLYHISELLSLAEACEFSVQDVRIFSNPLSGGKLGTRELVGKLPSGMVQAVEVATRRLPDRLSRKINTHLAVSFRVAG
jgi:2-polyprenyl-3-methyl-5-hydroxy-6-metoxy-1,4-benzoquinol methylase